MDETQLSGLINLEELWLGKNKIEKIQGISALKKLKRLDVQSNRLTSISGLEGQIDSLEELYLAHNGINDEGAMEESGLQLQFKNLTDLDLSKNRLTSCRPFAHLDTLTDLWLSQNEISTYDDIEPISRLGAREGAQLATIYLEHNPIYNDFEYRKKLKEIISSLTQIDADMIGGSGYGSAHLSQAISPDQYLEQMRVLQDTVVARAQVEAEASNADA
jgi:protein phosphatase 1 regulatory subunit 7